MYFLNPGIGAARARRCGRSHAAASRRRLSAGARTWSKYSSIAGDADMLEHADRDDAVELAARRRDSPAIESRRDPRGPTPLARCAAIGELLVRQRHAGDARAARFARDRAPCRRSRSRCRATECRSSMSSLAARWRFLASCASSSALARDARNRRRNIAGRRRERGRRADGPDRNAERCCAGPGVRSLRCWK